MAVGKNKRLSKGKKGIKKKTTDPFTKKAWFDIKAPAFFPNNRIGKTIVDKTIGQIEVSLADLADNPDDSFRKIRLVVNNVQGKVCTTNFCGLNFTSDKLRSLVKKSHTLIEAFTDLRTADGYLVRVFAIAFTFHQKNQVKKTTYTTHSKIKAIRRRMIQIIEEVSSSCSLEEFVQKLISEITEKMIKDSCKGICPITNVHIRKVKVLKAPKSDAAQVDTKMDVSEDVGVKA